MPVAWFLAPLETTPVPADRPAQITRQGYRAAILSQPFERCACLHVLGLYVIAKVRGSVAELAAIAALPGVTRIPVSLLDDPLSSLSAAQRATLANWLQARGWTLAEIQARFPNGIGSYTLGELLRFVCSRRRYVLVASDGTLSEGAEIAGGSVDALDRDVA